MKLKPYLSKARKKLKKVLGRVIPYNSFLKPTGVVRPNLSTQEKSDEQGVKIHLVYSQTENTLEIPDDLYEACPDYWKPERQAIIDYLVAELPNGRIHTDNESSVAVITQTGKAVDNVSLSLKNGIAASAEQNNIFQQQYFTKPVKLSGTVFSMLTGGAGLNNISHWFVDVLPRLHLLKESGLYDQVDWFLVPSLRFDYQRESLELLGIPAQKLIAGDHYPHVTADRVIASTAPRGNHTVMSEWLCRYVQRSFMPLAESVDQDTEESPFIYISRSDSSIRRVLNEEELIEKLKPYGFKVIVSSKLNVIQKIKLFSKAKVVLGASGAGLINFMFCKPSTTAIEIFNKGFILLFFQNIAQKINLDYHYIICKGNDKIQDAGQGQREHVVIETDKVLQLLEDLATKPGFEQMKQQMLV